MDILKWVISPPLDHCFMMACWCKWMCLHLCGGTAPALFLSLSDTTAHSRPTGMTAAHNDVMGAAAFASVVISLG